VKAIYERTAALIGEPAMEKLKKARVLVIGLGGVGGYTAEALARAGVGTLGFCDFDIVDPTNFNRQILALESGVGRLKVELAKERAEDINPSALIRTFPFKVDAESIGLLEIASWDYVADAVDEVSAKLLIIESCAERGVPVISSMGTGNKLNPFSYRIAPIEKTDTDPLARLMRKKLKERGISGIPVLYSPEPPKIESLEKGAPIPSISYMPAVAGLMLASHVINELIKE